MKKAFLIVLPIIFLIIIILVWYGKQIPKTESAENFSCIMVIDQRTNPLTGKLVNFANPCAPGPRYYNWKWLVVLQPVVRPINAFIGIYQR